MTGVGITGAARDRKASGGNVIWIVGLWEIFAANWQIAQFSQSWGEGVFFEGECGVLDVLAEQQHIGQAPVCFPSTVTTPRVWPGRKMQKKKS